MTRVSYRIMLPPDLDWESTIEYCYLDQDVEGNDVLSLTTEDREPNLWPNADRSIQRKWHREVGPWVAVEK